MKKPTEKPNNPNFSSGPCAKRPGWNLDKLKDSTLGRSHRSKESKTKLCFNFKWSIYLVKIVFNP